MSHAAVLFLLVLAPALALVLALLGLETLQANLLGWPLLAFGIGYPAGAIINCWIRRESFWQPKETSDKSLWLILPGMLTAFFAPPLEYIYLPALLPRAGWMQIMGLALIILSVALWAWTRTAIKSQYSANVRATAKHQLVQRGFYRYIRYLSYAGYFLLALGIGIGYSSLIGLAAIPILILPGFVYRMRLERILLARSSPNREL